MGDGGSGQLVISGIGQEEESEMTGQLGGKAMLVASRGEWIPEFAHDPDPGDAEAFCVVDAFPENKGMHVQMVMSIHVGKGETRGSERFELG